MNCLGLTPFSCKVGLVRTLLYCAFMVSGSRIFFMCRLLKLIIIQKKNSYPLNFVDKQVKFFLGNKMNDKIATVNTTNNVVKYYKLPFIGHISTDVQRNLNNEFFKYYCLNLNIKVVLTASKVGNTLNLKEPIPKSLKSFVVYKFVCPGCNACYIGDSTHHFIFFLFPLVPLVYYFLFVNLVQFLLLF